MASDDGFDAVNRAIAYAGQVAAIGVDGLMDTFLPHDVPLTTPDPREWTDPRECTDPSDGTVIT